MIVLDEHGEQWEVSKDDPGFPALQALKQRGISNPVLPLTILLYRGRRKSWFWPTEQGAIAIYEDFKLGRRGKTKEDFLHYTSCLDACQILEQCGMIMEEEK